MVIASRHAWLALFSVLIALAGVEFMRGTVAANARVDAHDWDAIASQLEPNRPLIVGTEWLGPEARMRLEAASDSRALGRPDLRGVRAFDVLWYASDAPSGPGRWARELAPFSRAIRTGQVRAGDLVVERWEVERPETIVDALGRDAPLQVTVDEGERRACRGDLRDGFRCARKLRKTGPIARRFAEVDFQPRRCVSIPVDAIGTPVLRRAAFRRGARLVGHLGFEDFNARLRNDGPVTMVLKLEGVEVARHTFTSGDGWAAFELPTDPGEGALSVSLVATGGGRWRAGPPARAGRQDRRICLELRALEDGGGA